MKQVQLLTTQLSLYIHRYTGVGSCYRSVGNFHGTYFSRIARFRTVHVFIYANGNVLIGFRLALRGGLCVMNGDGT